MALELNGTTGVSLVQDGVVTAADLASGAITSAALPAGSVLQVVSGSTATTVASSSSTFADTGLSATITPTSTSSKILVLVNQTGCGKGAANTYLELRLVRGASEIARIEGEAGYTASTATNSIGACSTSYLDSPNTTSATTYKTQLKSVTNISNVYVNSSNSRSTITLLEIAG